MTARLSELDARMLAECQEQSCSLTPGRIRTSLEFRDLIVRDFAEANGRMYWKITEKGVEALKRFA